VAATSSAGQAPSSWIMTQNRLVRCEVILGVICRVSFEGNGLGGGTEIRSDFFGLTLVLRSGR
jgi:hypothetical protein